MGVQISLQPFFTYFPYLSAISLSSWNSAAMALRHISLLNFKAYFASLELPEGPPTSFTPSGAEALVEGVSV